MTRQHQEEYVIKKLKWVATSLRELADRIDRQIQRSQQPEYSHLYLPLGELTEEIISNVLWAIPNFQLQRILMRAMEPCDDD